MQDLVNFYSRSPHKVSNVVPTKVPIYQILKVFEVFFINISSVIINQSYHVFLLACHQQGVVVEIVASVFS